MWRVVPRSHVGRRRIIGTRWASCNKGDELHPEIRCRLVAQEIKTPNATSNFYVATPPVETLRLILSHAAECEQYQVSLVDISRAYFNAEAEREVYIELPPEAGHGPDEIGLLAKRMYGTRDAAQGWESTYASAPKDMGFRRGRSNPCLFHHPDREVKLCVHGDDFFSVATAAGLDWFENEILRRFDGKVKGRLSQPGDEV